MSELTIHEWSGRKRKVHFVGYNRDHTACLIRNEQQERRAIDLWLPSDYGLNFREGTIPKSPPVEIRPAILHVPSFLPVPKHMAENYGLISAMSTPTARREPFSLLCVHPRKDWTFRDLDKTLRKRLVKEKERLHIEHDAEESQIAKLPVKEQEVARGRLKYEFSFKRSVGSTVSKFDATLDDVKEGALGLLETMLQEEFLQHYGFNPAQIALDGGLFCKWVKQDGIGRELDDVARRNAPRVRYKISFASQPPDCCWLEGIEDRPPTPQEIEDFDGFEGKATKSVTQQREEKKNRQQGGASTFKLRNYHSHARRLINYMREVRDKEIAAGRKHGAIVIAIKKGRNWWDEEYPALRHLLQRGKVSDSTLRNWIDKDPVWLKSRPRS